MASLVSFGQNARQTISGSVTDAEGNPLASAHVHAENTNYGAITNENGVFAFEAPSGSYTLQIQYIGYEDEEVSVIVKDQAVHLEIILIPVSFDLNTTVIHGRMTRGQAKALNIQKQASNITNVVDVEQFGRYPDVSAAETVQRLPGISITRDQGEGEFVQVRGVPEQFNSLTMNGQRMPSMEPDAGRSVGLDLVQSYLIQKITLTKTLTPDMDADAIGGMVDFTLREATKKKTLEVYAGYGYNQQQSEFQEFGKDILSFSAVASRRVAKNKLGLLVAGSYFNTDRGSMFNSQRFTNLAADSIYRRRTTDYDVNRERYGFLGNFDYTHNKNHKWVLTANYNKYIDDEIRMQARYTWDNTREERRVRNRIEDQTLYFAMLKGEHKIKRAKLDYSVSYSVGEEDLPDRTEFRYRRSVPALATLTRAEQADLSANTVFNLEDGLAFNRVEFEPRFTEESNTTYALNLTFPISEGEKSSIKLGGKYRSLSREYRDGEFRPEPNDGVTIQDFPEGTFPFPGVKFTDNNFSDLGFNLAPGDINYAEELGGYNASETVFATYAMNTTKWTKKLSSLIGVRMEATTTDYTSTSNELTGEGSYVNVLPSAHFTYKQNKKNQFRLAYSSGISRPNYTSLIPYEIEGDDEISRGNADLKAITANNFDFMFERYTKKLGFLGVGVFAKLIENQIITEQVGTEDGLPIISPVNGASASLFGFEASINQNLNKFKIPLTLNANYTFTSSKADFGDSRDDLPLANSPMHVGNLSFLYDNPKNGFSFVLGGVYRHFIFNKFENTNQATDGNEPIWLDKTFHLDFSAAYKINKRWNLKLQMNNLTNQANVEVTEKPSEDVAQWSEREAYGFWGVLGVEFKL